MPGNGATPYQKEEFIAIEDIKYDSPQLLKKALKQNIVNPGKDWAKGYNFMILRDAESKTPLLFVIGWNKELNDMVNVAFNVTTGEQFATPPLKRGNLYSSYKLPRFHCSVKNYKTSLHAKEITNLGIWTLTTHNTLFT